MTSRSRLYIKFRKAFKLIGTAKGRAWLAEQGLHPIHFTVSGTYMPTSQEAGYAIDKKGNIVGTSNPGPLPRKIYLTLPKLEPASYPVKFELADPSALQSGSDFPQSAIC